MRVVSAFSAAALAVAAVAVSSDALAQRNRGQSTTAVVLNYQRLAADSALGRDMQAKIGALRQQIGVEAQSLQPEQQSLDQERQRLAQASRNMSPEQIRNSATLAPQFQQFSQRVQQFEGRAAGLQGDLQCSQIMAALDFRRQVSPVVVSVMQSRGAGIVIDASSVTELSPEFDITNVVVQQLDQNQNTRTANVTRHAAAECTQQQGAAPAQ